MVSPAFPEQQFQQQLGARVRPQPSGLVPQPDERTLYNPAFHQVEQETPDIANILAGYPLDPTTTFGTTAQTDAPSLASLPTEIATELGSVVASDPVVQAAGGVAGGVLDIFGRLLNPQTSPFAGKGDQPYSPMFQPENLWGGLGREIVSGMAARYPEGPIDHRSLSGPEKAFLFADIADPSGVVGDVLKAGAKVIPEGTVAGLAGVMPLKARQLLKGTKVTSDFPYGTEGNPTRVYHGTQAAFSEFSPEFQDADAMLGRGMYFTENPTIAGGAPGVEGYAETKQFMDPETGIYAKGQPNVQAAYLNLQKPLDLGGGAQDDVITQMAEEIFSFAKSPRERYTKSVGGGYLGSYPVNRADFERAKDLKGFSQNLYNIGGNYADPDDFLDDLNIDANAIDDFIDSRQWDKAEEGLLDWFRKASNSNEDVRQVVNDFFFYNQDNTKRWGKEVWTNGLQNLGYDGMTHIGQGGWGQGGLKHRVWVVFEEEVGTTAKFAREENVMMPEPELSYRNRIFPFLDLEGMPPPPPRGETAEMLENIFRTGQ